MDSFFPFIEEIEKEVMVVEDLAFSDDPAHPRPLPPPMPPTPKPEPKVMEGSPGSSTIADPEKDVPQEQVSPEDKPIVEKPHVAFGEPSLMPTRGPRPALRFSLLPFRLTLRRLRRRVRKLLRRALLKLFPWFDPRRAAARSLVSAGEGTGAAAALRRMARTRRLVTNLTRLLATKADVVARVQKRLFSQAHGDPVGLGGGGVSGTDVVAAALGGPTGPTSAGSLGGDMGVLENGSKSKDAAKVAIYYGDVQGAAVQRTSSWRQLTA